MAQREDSGAHLGNLLVQTRGEEKLGGGQQKGGAGAQGAVEKGAISEKPHVQYTCSLSPFSFPLQS